MSRKKTRLTWINHTLVESPYYIALCQSSRDFKHEMRRLGVPKAHWSKWVLKGKGGRVHEFKNKGKLVCIVCVRRSTNRVGVYGLLVHEAVHIWQWIRTELGELQPSSEFEACAVQNIAQNLIEAYGVKP